MTLLNAIDLDIVALVLLIVLLIFLRIQYSSDHERNKLFRELIYATILFTVFDIISQYTNENAMYYPKFVNYFSSSAYCLSHAVVIMIFFNYVELFLQENGGKSVSYYVRVYFPLAFMVECLIVNYNCNLIFSYNMYGHYSYGCMMLVTYLYPVYYYIMVIAMVIRNKKRLSTREYAAIYTYIGASLITIVLQLIFPDKLVLCLGATIATLCMLISLETPDFQNLSNTMKALEVARESADKANAAKSMFLSSMSHEIRTPINGVLGMNEIILKSDISDEVRECAHYIDSSGRTLLSVINDILDFSKIESGMMDIVPVEYSLKNVVSDAYLMMRQRAVDKGLEFVLECNPKIPKRLYGDEVRIKQIMINFITNAIKYTGEGKVTLKIDQKIATENNVDLVISVSDTGMGIKPEVMGTLFDAYTRVDQERNRNIEGTGLGLRITKMLVDLMKGTVDVESEYGKGSVFTAVIPQKVIDQTAVGEFMPHMEYEREEKAEEYDFNGYSILVVDDVNTNLRVVKGLLKKTNINVDTELSGEDALKRMREKEYDLIFFDHLMPQMDGIETLERSRTMEGNLNKGVPIVILTANAIAGAREEYLCKGFADYLAKPIKSDELKKMIAKYIRNE